jgi:hypothetical protein
VLPETGKQFKEIIMSKALLAAVAVASAFAWSGAIADPEGGVPSGADETTPSMSTLRSLDRFTGGYKGWGPMANPHTPSASNESMPAHYAEDIAEQNRQLIATQASLRRATSGVDSAKIDSTLVNFRTTSANLAVLSADFKQTSAKLDSIITKVNSGTGTVGMALYDPGAYNVFRSLIAHLDSVLVDVKRYPRRYITLNVY